MIVDFDKIKESGYIKDEGTYTLTVKDYDVKVTSNGNEMIVAQCESDDGDMIQATFVMLDNCMWKFKNFISACYGAELKGQADPMDIMDAVKGKKFVGEVKRCKPRMDPLTQTMVESKFFEIVKFKPIS